MADGLLRALDEPETSWFGSVLYPLRGAEGLGMILALAAVFWFFTVLVPEYCLAIFGDAESLGAPTIGKLIVVISSLPFVILSPLVLIYWLQYLGRVLVSSAMGETTPPRTPDRNFDGVFNGLSPWFIWLTMGALIGLLPVLWYMSALRSIGDGSPWIEGGLVLLGLPYIVAALMVSFLHEDPFAAMPWRVVGSLLRLGERFWALTWLLAAGIGLAASVFVMALLLRPNHFWLYVFACLVGWVVAHWTAMVAMRLLGTYYFRRKDILGWNREHPRWGVRWRL